MIDKRSFFLGFGVGFIILSIVFHFAININNNIINNKKIKEIELEKDNKVSSEEESEQLEYIEVKIPQGNNAMQISNILFEAKVIDDPIKFKNFITNSSSTNILKAGNYKFKKESKFEDILKNLIE